MERKRDREKERKERKREREKERKREREKERKRERKKERKRQREKESKRETEKERKREREKERKREREKERRRDGEMERSRERDNERKRQIEIELELQKRLGERERESDRVCLDVPPTVGFVERLILLCGAFLIVHGAKNWSSMSITPYMFNPSDPFLFSHCTLKPKQVPQRFGHVYDPVDQFAYVPAGMHASLAWEREVSKHLRFHDSIKNILITSSTSDNPKTPKPTLP